MDPGGTSQKIQGIPTVEPAFGLPAIWITHSQKESADIATRFLDGLDIADATDGIKWLDWDPRVSICTIESSSTYLTRGSSMSFAASFSESSAENPFSADL